MTWFDHAACRGHDTDRWFPTHGHSDPLAAARDICTDCPVQQDCLDYAIDNQITVGIWGGLSERQRARLRARRGHLRPVPCRCCGTQFVPSNRKHVVCSDRCRHVLQRGTRRPSARQEGVA